MRSHQETTQACTLDMIVGAMNITNIGRSLQVSMGLSWVFFVFDPSSTRTQYLQSVVVMSKQ